MTIDCQQRKIGEIAGDSWCMYGWALTRCPTLLTYYYWQSYSYNFCISTEEYFCESYACCTGYDACKLHLNVYHRHCIHWADCATCTPQISHSDSIATIIAWNIFMELTYKFVARARKENYIAWNMFTKLNTCIHSLCWYSHMYSGIVDQYGFKVENWRIQYNFFYFFSYVSKIAVCWISIFF